MKRFRRAERGEKTDESGRAADLCRRDCCRRADFRQRSFDELKGGQDITYKTAGGTVTHRIVAIDQAARTVTTQGLTNNVADTPVTAENIVGRVQLCLPWMGYPVKILNDTKRSFA